VLPPSSAAAEMARPSAEAADGKGPSSPFPPSPPRSPPPPAAPAADASLPAPAPAVDGTPFFSPFFSPSSPPSVGSRQVGEARLLHAPSAPGAPPSSAALQITSQAAEVVSEGAPPPEHPRRVPPRSRPPRALPALPFSAGAGAEGVAPSSMALRCAGAAAAAVCEVPPHRPRSVPPRARPPRAPPPSGVDLKLAERAATPDALRDHRPSLALPLP